MGKSKTVKVTAEQIANAILYGGFHDSKVTIYAAGADKDGNVVLDVVTGNNTEDEALTSVTLTIVKQRKGKF